MIRQEFNITPTGESLHCNEIELAHIADYLRDPSNGIHTEIVGDYVRLVTNTKCRVEELNLNNVKWVEIFDMKTSWNEYPK